MKIDSVRELKQQLLQAHVEPLIEKPVAMAARAMSARPVSAVDAVQRNIALGVSHDPQKGFRLAVRIQSRILEKSPSVDSIVSKAKGEVDVRYVGRLTKRQGMNLRSRHRPLVIGCSAGHYLITAGTLGCFVETKGKDPRMLSNNHVFANENAARKGDPILQPGRYDGGKKGGHTVGSLDRFVRLKKTATNFVDCAIATIADGIKFDQSTLAGIGDLQASVVHPVDVGMTVRKVGRTTGTTSGRVTAFELDNVVVGYDLGNLRFDDQIEIEGADDRPFSQGGDSGSLIVDNDRYPVALLFAGGDTGGSNGKGLTYANPIQTVLDALKVSLLP